MSGLQLRRVVALPGRRTARRARDRRVRLCFRAGHLEALLLVILRRFFPQQLGDEEDDEKNGAQRLEKSPGDGAARVGKAVSERGSRKDQNDFRKLCHSSGRLKCSYQHVDSIAGSGKYDSAYFAKNKSFFVLLREAG